MNRNSMATSRVAILFKHTLMSHEIIAAIYISENNRVMVRHAANNLLPRTFRTEEYEHLTEILRTEGLRRLDEEILSYYFQRRWQGPGRYSQAVERALTAEQLDIYAEWRRCFNDENYQRQLIAHIAERYLVPINQ